MRIYQNPNFSYLKPAQSPAASDYQQQMICARNSNTLSAPIKSREIYPNTKAREHTLNSKNNFLIQEALSKPLLNPNDFDLMSVDCILYGNEISKFSIKQNVVTGVRFPNEHSFEYLKKGYPAKNFLTKPKTSKHGPTAGLIAVEAKYSQVKPEKIKTQQAEIDKALKHGARKIDLTLNKDLVKKMSDSGMIELQDLSRINNAEEFLSPPAYLRCFKASYPSGLEYFIIDENHKVYDIRMQPVQVLSNVPTHEKDDNLHLPATADYDLFSIIPENKFADNYRKVSIPPRFINGAKFPLKFMEVEKLYGKDEDRLKGNISAFIEINIKRLNKEISEAGRTGDDIISHNNETGNPFSPGFVEGEKVVFFLPDGKALTIETEENLLKFYGKIKEKGYKPEYSARFGF